MEKKNLKFSSRSLGLFIIVMLCVGIPLYSYFAVLVVEILEPSHFLFELAIYAFAGIAWILPVPTFYSVWKGLRAKEAGSKPGAEAE